MSKESDLLTGVMPSAAPTPEELAEWHALSQEEQVRRLERALSSGFSAPATSKSIDDIIAEAKASMLKSRDA